MVPYLKMWALQDRVGRGDVGLLVALVAVGCGGLESSAGDGGGSSAGGHAGRGGETASGSGAGLGNGGEASGAGAGSGGSEGSGDGGGESGGVGSGEGGESNGGQAAGGGAGGTNGEASGGSMWGSGGDGSGGSVDSDTCIDFECTDLGLGPCCLRYQTDPATNGDEDRSRICTLFVPDGSVEVGFVLHEPEEISALAAVQCSVLNGSLEISGLGIETLLGLETVESISGAVILDAPNLASIDALMGVTSVGTLSVENCDSLKVIDLPALTTLSGNMELSPLPGDLTVIANGLETLRLSALEEAGGVIINVNPVLSEVEMGSLERTTSLTIASNPVLSTLHGLPMLQRAGEAHIGINPLLPQCEVDDIAARAGGCLNCMNNDTTAVCD